MQWCHIRSPIWIKMSEMDSMCLIRMWHKYKDIVFILIAAHDPIRAHPSYFEVINHKIINCLPRSIHEAYILSLVWLGISLKIAKIFNFWVDPCYARGGGGGEVLPYLKICYVRLLRPPFSAHSPPKDPLKW